jgi:hypothetical protein
MLNPFALQVALSLDFTQGALPLGTTLARASTATYFDAAGVLQSAAIDTGRFDHDPKTLASKGMLYEHGAATNALLQSSPSTAGVWGSFGTCTLTTNQPGKGGATSATKVTPQALGVSSYRIRQNYEWAGDKRAISFFIKPSGWQWIAVHFNDLNLRRVWFDIINGVVGATQGGGDIGGSIIDVGGGVWMVAAWATTDLASGLVEIWASGGNGAANINANPNGVDAFIIESIQVDVGATPTSRILTTAAPVTRAAETLTITVPGGVDVIRVTHDDNSYTEFEVAAGPFVVPALSGRGSSRSTPVPTLPATFKPAGDRNGAPGPVRGGNMWDLNGVTRHYFPYGCDWLDIGIANALVNLGNDVAFGRPARASHDGRRRASLDAGRL